MKRVKFVGLDVHAETIAVAVAEQGEEIRYGKDNPRYRYAVGLRTKPAQLVRGSSRRITIIGSRPANIRLINRREKYLDHDLRCLLIRRTDRRAPLVSLAPDGASF